MRVHLGLNRTQSAAIGQLGTDHCDKMAPVAETSGEIRSVVPFDGAIEFLPWEQLQNCKEDARVSGHGIVLLASGDVAKRRKPIRINAVQLVQ